MIRVVLYKPKTFAKLRKHYLSTCICNLMDALVFAALLNPVQKGVRCEVGIRLQLFQQVSKHGFDSFDALFCAGYRYLWFAHVRPLW